MGVAWLAIMAYINKPRANGFILCNSLAYLVVVITMQHAYTLSYIAIIIRLKISTWKLITFYWVWSHWDWQSERWSWTSQGSSSRNAMQLIKPASVLGQKADSFRVRVQCNVGNLCNAKLQLLIWVGGSSQSVWLINNKCWGRTIAYS